MSQAQQLEGQEEAQAAIRANISTRYSRLDSYERWASGTQYEGLKSWWDDSVPLWERAPCIVYPVVEIAARSNVDLCLGEGRYPSFSSKQSEDESDDANGLSPEESDALDRFIREHHKIGRFRRTVKECFYAGQVAGTGAIIHGVRNGRPTADVVPAKWCTPEFDADDNVSSLEIRYPYTEEVKQSNGKKKLVAKLYRRVITAEKDTEYHPADADKHGNEPAWKENTSRSVEHKFGFCPVVWYPLLKAATTVNVIDGNPIHRFVTDEIRQHDIARSQWHRGALLSEPQIVEIGVPAGWNPTELGRMPGIPSSEQGGDSTKTPDGLAKLNGEYRDGSPKQARKKGPGHTWQYPNKDSRVETLTYPGDALKAQEDNARDLRIKLQESLCVVFLDPENIKFAATTSGKALLAIKQKQLDRCDQFRDDLTDALLEPSVQMQLRISHVILSRGQRLRVPGADKVKPILARFFVASEWQGPDVAIKWGPYFKPDPAEQKAIVALVREALGGGKIGRPMITLRVAVGRIAEIFGIENIGAIVEELEANVEEENDGADDDEESGDDESAGENGEPIVGDDEGQEDGSH